MGAVLTWEHAGLGFLLLCAGLLGWEMGWHARGRAMTDDDDPLAFWRGLLFALGFTATAVVATWLGWLIWGVG